LQAEQIITHPGSAHFDEVTAISLIMAVHDDKRFKIERREPTTEELDNPDIWVVDVGDRHEPEKLNFDHHQDANCPASFVLIAEFLGLKETMSVMPWWQFKDSVDRIGAEKSSEIFKAGDELVNKNPVEAWFTDQFASPDGLPPNMLRAFGKNLISSARTIKRQFDFWKSSRRLDIAGVPAMIGETRESAGLEEFRRLDDNPPDIVISLDSRGEGWRLFRYEGTRVDFSLIADHPETAFAHNSGFLAKTKERLTIDKLINLVSKAVTKKP
jgi:hypothetical protein